MPRFDALIYDVLEDLSDVVQIVMHSFHLNTICIVGLTVRREEEKALKNGRVQYSLRFVEFRVFPDALRDQLD